MVLLKPWSNCPQTDQAGGRQRQHLLWGAVSVVTGGGDQGLREFRGRAHPHQPHSLPVSAKALNPQDPETGPNSYEPGPLPSGVLGWLLEGGILGKHRIQNRDRSSLYLPIPRG